MTTLLDDLELALTDLMQTGLATAGLDTGERMAKLSQRCEERGLHTGAQLFDRIGQLLKARSHIMEKQDSELTAVVCRAEHYITLCRRRMTEEDIRRRWQEGGRL